MTRINVVHPSILTRQHLLAEWHEIGRIITLAENGVDPKEIPDQYTMGKGHMKFFTNKLGYITLRMAWIANELEARGFNVDRRILLDAGGRAIIVGFGEKWQPKESDLAINLYRLIERAPDHEPYQKRLNEILEYSL